MMAELENCLASVARTAWKVHVFHSGLMRKHLEINLRLDDGRKLLSKGIHFFYVNIS